MYLWLKIWLATMCPKADPKMCPKIRTYRRCTYVLTSSTRCYQLSNVSLIRVLVRFSVRFHMRQLVTTRWWSQNVCASTICTNLRIHCGTSLKRRWYTYTFHVNPLTHVDALSSITFHSTPCYSLCSAYCPKLSQV